MSTEAQAKIKADLDRIKASADLIATHASNHLHDVFASSVNLAADGLHKLEQAISHEASKPKDVQPPK
jgi:hypothetical protein